MTPAQTNHRTSPRLPAPLRRVVFPSQPDAPTADLPLAALVLTIHDGSSYDPMFREYRQESSEGTVSVWECSNSALAPTLDQLQGERAERDVFAEFAAEVAAVDAGSVVFNWECCGGCGDAGFADTALVVRVAAWCLDRGFTLMFSDFSLKALLAAWRSPDARRSFGPSPLVRLGEYAARAELRFDNVALQRCGVAQLERVGELCERGHAEVAALGGTLAYTVDASIARQAPYKLTPLTVATALDGVPALARHAELLQAACVTEVGPHRGAAGHVIIEYPSGGAMILSSGHWCELVRLDVSAERLLEASRKAYGDVRTSAMQQELECAAPEARADLVQKYARAIVNQSPASRKTK